jgi:hypothetical protein
MLAIRSIKSLMLAAVLAFFHPGALADDCVGYGDGGGACTNVTAAALYMETGDQSANTGMLYVKPSGSTAGLPCATVSGYLSLTPGAVNFKSIYASLLVSYTTGKLVDIRLIKGANNACVMSYVILH